MRDPKAYGAALKAARLKAGLTQEELAAKLNRDWKYVSKVENGHMIPDVVTSDEWIEICEAEEYMHVFRFGTPRVRQIS